MATNVTTADRAFRILSGIGLATAAAFGLISPVGYVGLVPLVTGLVGYCPVYRIAGLR